MKKNKQLLFCCHCSLALPPWACCCSLRLRLGVDGWPHRATNCCVAFIRSVASENKKHVFGKDFHSIDARNSSFVSWRQIRKKTPNLENMPALAFQLSAQHNIHFKFVAISSVVRFWFSRGPPAKSAVKLRNLGTIEN